MKKILILSVTILAFGFAFVVEGNPIESDVAPDPGRMQERSQIRERLNRLKELGVDVEGLAELFDVDLDEPEESFCHDFEESFEYEDEGGDVEALGTILRQESYLKEGITEYDWDLAQALYEYQNDKDMEPDSLVERVGFRFGDEAKEHFNEKYGCDQELDYEVLGEFDQNRKIDSEMEEVVQSEEDLEEYLEEVPEIDFETHKVAVIGLGEKPTGGYSINISNLEEQDDKVTIYYEVSEPGDVATTVITYPSKVVSVSTQGKDLEIEKVDSLDDSNGEVRGVITECDNSDDCGYVSVNCCPENAGAQWECVNEEETELDCPDNPVCPQVISPRPAEPCQCMGGECQGGQGRGGSGLIQ